MSKENILVTGTSGFVGSATTKELSKDHQVRKFEGDITEIEDWAKNLQDGDIIFLIAGVRTETEKDVEVNAESIGLLSYVIDRDRKIPTKMILVSSQAVYMGNTPPFSETDKPNPATTYGRSKLDGEQIALSLSEKFNIPLVILRYSTVLGAGVREESKMSGPLFFWVNAARSNEPIKVYQDGNQSRDYVHIDDVVSANLLALDLPEGIYNVGGGEPVKLLDLAQWIKESVGSDSEILIMGGEATEADPRAMLSDTSKIREFGWEPKKTAREAVKDFTSSS